MDTDPELRLVDLYASATCHQEEAILAVYMWDRLTPEQRAGVARQFEEYQAFSAEMSQR